MAFYITDCPTHGVKMTDDRRSAALFIGATLFCAMTKCREHDEEHWKKGETCWVCCDQMVTDPYDEFAGTQAGLEYCLSLFMEQGSDETDD